MKAPKMILLLFLLAAGVSAQPSTDVSDPPDLAVAEKSWRKEIRHPALGVDPFVANDEQKEFERAQKDNAIRNSVRVREGGTPQPTVRTKPLENESQGPSARYVYRAKVRNTGTKTILALVWDYRFFDPLTLEEVGLRPFTHRVKIRPGKGFELIGHSASPPARVIDSRKAAKDLGAQYSEKVVIRRVEYADGSVWLRPTN
ncbi:MAG: hypothetical protein M3410_04335 [Acidobacteriota bacterium]|nr:hypothetical protein [Acidobacteriota bacterium]